MGQEPCLGTLRPVNRGDSYKPYRRSQLFSSGLTDEAHRVPLRRARPSLFSTRLLGTEAGVSSGRRPPVFLLLRELFSIPAFPRALWGTSELPWTCQLRILA